VEPTSWILDPRSTYVTNVTGEKTPVTKVGNLEFKDNNTCAIAFSLRAPMSIDSVGAVLFD